ncbi:MAG: hypothetical protein ABMA64_02615 [Myxococcota bacterium]
MITWLAGCAVRHVEHYEPVGFHVDAPDPAFVEFLPELVAAEVGRRRVPALTWPAGAADRVEALPPEVLYAVWICTKPWTRGAELDLRVDLGDGPRLVQLRWTTDRAVEVAWADGEPRRAEMPPGTQAEWRDGLTRAYGLGGFEGEWTDDEVGDVALALELLTDDELVALDGVVVARASASPRAPQRELAYFDPTTEPPRLSFFDLAFESEPDSFAGPPDRPVSAGVTTALHEFAHTVADAPLRRAYEAYLARWRAGRDEADPQTAAAIRDDARAMFRAYVRLGRSGPVVEAWDEFRDGRKGPSTYGFREPNESFAEAFALYHVDPDALDRAIPGASAWFVAGTHTEAAKLDR